MRHDENNKTSLNLKDIVVSVQLFVSNFVEYFLTVSSLPSIARMLHNLAIIVVAV